MRIWTKDEIIAHFDMDRAVQLVKTGFIAYSQQAVLVPPVQNFHFAAANGDCCIKSAHVQGSETFAVKVSTGFYDNAAQGLPSNSGMVMLFSAQNGMPLALLQDEGWLTSVRTGIAGQLAASVLAPREVHGIGIIGSGDQARWQLTCLKPVTACRDVYVWSVDAAQSRQFASDMAEQGFTVTVCATAEQVARHANLIVTTTPAREALLQAAWIAPGTHITAVGADGPGKQELDPQIVARAGAIVVDAIKQCSAYGEVSHALSAGLIAPDALRELGDILAQGIRARDDADPAQITIADLTGVAVQDAQIAASIVN